MPQGKNTSVYLNAELREAVEASGRKITELIWRGIEMLNMENAARAQPLTAEDLHEPCTHPRARRQKGLCMACGSHVG